MMSPTSLVSSRGMKKALGSSLPFICWYFFCAIVLSSWGPCSALPATDITQAKCEMRSSCEQCVPAMENDNHCVWCMSTSECVSSLSVYKPKNLSESRKCAGVVAKFSRCSTDPIDYHYLMKKRHNPALHPLLASKVKIKVSQTRTPTKTSEPLQA